MLKSVRVKNFKALKDSKFELSNLTLLTGDHCVGKSSLLQSLLLLRQSYERNVLAKGLLLNSTYVSESLGRNVLCSYADSKQLSFELEWDDLQPSLSSRKFVFDCDESSDYMLAAEAINTDGLDALSLFNNKFQYLALGTHCGEGFQKRSDYHVKVERTIGVHGEYLAHFIHEYAQSELEIPELKHDSIKSNLLIDNINAWMGELCQGIRVVTEADEKSNTVALRFVIIYEKIQKETPYLSPEQIGFHIVQALAIFVSILSAKPGDLIILENPERCMNVAGQSIIGKLSATAANHGVQIIIETHSEHIVNGSRVSVKRNKLDKDKEVIFFLTRCIVDDCPSVHTDVIKVIDRAKLDHWPDGFFDQVDKDLDVLF